jgi:hypothetical protein
MVVSCVPSPRRPGESRAGGVYYPRPSKRVGSSTLTGPFLKGGPLVPLCIPPGAGGWELKSYYLM